MNEVKLLGWICLCLGLVLLVLTRTVNLTKLPIFCDEAIYIRWSQIAQSDALMRFISLTDGKQPFQTWITIPLLKQFSDPLVAGRAQAVLAGILLPLILGAFSLIFYSQKKQTLVLIFFLVVFCPYLLFHSRMALAEAWLTFFTSGTIVFSYLLGKNRRLDIALLTGAWLGFSLLVKSQALFFLILFPLGAIFVPINFSKRQFREILKFMGLFSLAVVIAYIIYNVQRLSPWMHMISQKNKDFAVPLFQALTEWRAFYQNLKVSTNWFWTYLTPPVFLLSLTGLVLWFRKDWKRALFLAGWFFLPFGAINLIARIYNSRYLAFLAFIPLLWLVFLLTEIKLKINRRLYWLILLLVFLLPVFRSYQLIVLPDQFPFTRTDRGYLEGWTAGYGIEETVEILTLASYDQSVVVGTEGNFGLLSQGLEIYFASNPNVDVFGFYPLPQLPPKELLEAVEVGKRAFFVVNNTPGDFTNSNLSLVSEFPKINNNGSLRLYEVVGEK